MSAKEALGVVPKYSLGLGQTLLEHQGGRKPESSQPLHATDADGSVLVRDLGAHKALAVRFTERAESSPWLFLGGLRGLINFWHGESWLWEK